MSRAPLPDDALPDDALTVGVDIGGTKIAAGVVDRHGTVLDTVQVRTPADEKGTAAAIAEVIDRVRGDNPRVAAVGVAAAGYVDDARSTVRFAPNLDWNREPLKEIVADATGLPVVIENDANAAAWGEFTHGAAVDHDDMVMLTVGTGLGGGIVVQGRLHRGRFGSGGEVGHYRAVPDGLPCGCGQRGCMEQYASGTAHTRRAREAAVANPEAAAAVLALGDGTAAGLRGADLTAAAQQGDAFACWQFAATGAWLGQAMADLGAVLDPGVFVIGGGVSQAGDLLLRPAVAAYRQRLSAFDHRPSAEVRLAALGPAAGVIGAADLARRGWAEASWVNCC